MPVTVVVGGQFGGEGKGKVAHYLAQEMKASIAVRVGGSNSGHTVIDSSGSPIIFRHLPTAALLPDVTCVLGAGSYINPEILLQEVFRIGLATSQTVNRSQCHGSHPSANSTKKETAHFDNPSPRPLAALVQQSPDA